MKPQPQTPPDAEYAFTVVTSDTVREVMRVRGLTRAAAGRVLDKLNAGAKPGARWVCRYAR